MAVTPLRSFRPVIEDEVPQTDDRQVRIELDDDGLKTIEIGTPDKKRTRRKPGGSDFNRNLAEDLDDTALSTLAAYLLDGIEADEAGRKMWEETANKGAKYLGIKLTDPMTEVADDGAIFQGVSTAMLEANIKLWGTAYAELLPTGGPVKVERMDAPPVTAPDAGHNGGSTMVEDQDSQPGQAPDDTADQQGDNLAEALEKDMNWYLTKGDRGYYPDFSAMLMTRDRIGIAFREVYRCPIKRMPISRWVMAQDLIIKGNPPHLDDAERVTARKKLSQSTMRRMMVAGEYLDVSLVAPTGAVSDTELVIGESQGIDPTSSLPRDFDHTVYECSCELGSGTNHDLYGSLEILDEDETGEAPGYPLPYRVTIDYDSRTVLAIRRNWKPGDDQHRKRRRYIKYGFIPADGFYDWGLIHLVGNPTQGATMLQRSCVDASILANFPAWAMSQGAASRMENTVLRPGPGEVIKIATTAGSKIQDEMMSWPYKEPSELSMALAAKMEGDVKSLAGVVDIPVGEGRIGNTPVGTIMSYIESVSMVPGAVHKADHISQAEEFELLRELLAEEPEILWRGNKSPAHKWQTSEELMSPDLAPKADPNTPSQIHRLLKVQGLISAGGLPQFAMDAQGPIANNREVWKYLTEVIVGGDHDRFIYPPQPPQQAPPPPDPRIEAAKIKAQSQAASDQAKLQGVQITHDAKMQELAVESQDKAADRQATDQREELKAGVAKTKVGADMATTAVGHAHDEGQAVADRAHATQTQQSDQAHALTAPFLAPPEPDKGSGQ